MRRQKIIVQDSFGHHYRLHLRSEVPIRAPLQPENFRDGYYTWQFVSKLKVDHNSWLRLLWHVSESPPNRHLTLHECQHAIAALILRGVIKLYRLMHLDRSGQQTSYPLINAAHGEQYHFIPTTELLSHEPREAKFFHREPTQATHFIQQLALTDEQLAAITRALSCPLQLSAASTAPRAKQIAQLEQALIAGKIAVEQARVAPLKQDNLETLPVTPATDKPMTLGPHEEPGYESPEKTNTMSGGEVVPNNKTIQSNSPIEIHFGLKVVDSRTQGFLDQLPENLSQSIFHKKQIGVTDLARLTAATGDEFALFTRGSQRLVVRGHRNGIDLSVGDIKLLQEQGYKWSGHSHPGTFARDLEASGNIGGAAQSGDRFVLDLMKQERSLILNSGGSRNVFDRFGNRILDG